jgi:hypothetical protein
MESTIKDNKSDNDNIENSSNRPKCLSGDMAKHPHFLSIPLTPSSKIAEKSDIYRRPGCRISSNSFHVENVSTQNFM